MDMLEYSNHTLKHVQMTRFPITFGTSSAGPVAASQSRAEDPDNSNHAFAKEKERFYIL